MGEILFPRPFFETIFGKVVVSFLLPKAVDFYWNYLFCNETLSLNKAWQKVLNFVVVWSIWIKTEEIIMSKVCCLKIYSFISNWYIFLQWKHFFFQAVWGLKGKEVLPLAQGFIFIGLQFCHNNQFSKDSFWYSFTVGSIKLYSQ